MADPVEEIEQLEQEKHDIRKTAYRERQGRQRVEKKNIALQEENEILKKKLRDALLRDGNKNFSLRAGFEMALRMIAAATAAYSMGIAGGFDAHGTTVGR